MVETSKGHEKKMGELLRQLEEERSLSANMKSRFNILQQQLSDAQNSAQVCFQD
jgi:kinesin family protein 5